MSALDDLLAILDLAQVTGNHYRGDHLNVGWPRVFGGQIIAQSLVAAARTINGRDPHSIHGQFLQAGDLSRPIDYFVDRTRDGGSFSTRIVTGRQGSETIFTAMISSNAREAGLEHKAEQMPDAPDPELLMTDSEMRTEFASSAPAYLRRYWETPGPIELRPTSLKRYRSREPLEPRNQIWFRANCDLPADQFTHTIVLAYASDMTLLDTALFPHSKTVFDRDLQIASLDHSIWLHRPFRVDEWVLYVQDSPSASGSLGFTRGHLFARDGRLAATVAQQGLIRMLDAAGRGPDEPRGAVGTRFDC